MFFAVLGLAIIGIAAFSHQRTLARGRRARAWPTTRGAILAAEVAKAPVGGSYMLTPAVTYSYEVGGQRLQGSSLRMGRPPMFNTPSKAEAMVAKYPVGSQVTVHYDPAAPSTSALELTVGAGYGGLALVSVGATLVVLGAIARLLGI